MFKRSLLLIGLALLVPATSAGAFTGVKYERFTATIHGVQTNSWDLTEPTYSDCNGVQTKTGKGTEVFRFHSTEPVKVLVQRNAGGVQWKVGTWDQFKPEDPLGFLVNARLTRHGAFTTQWSGGYCGRPATITTPDPSDCGGRKGFAAVVFTETGKRVRVSVAPSGFLHPFSSCPVYAPEGVDQGGFTDAYGRLSPRLLFGHRKRIVVDDGQRHRRNDPAPGVHALATTHFRLVLVRH